MDPGLYRYAPIESLRPTLRERARWLLSPIVAVVVGSSLCIVSDRHREDVDHELMDVARHHWATDPAWDREQILSKCYETALTNEAAWVPVPPLPPLHVDTQNATKCASDTNSGTAETCLGGCSGSVCVTGIGPLRTDAEASLRVCRAVLVPMMNAKRVGPFFTSARSDGMVCTPGPVHADDVDVVLTGHGTDLRCKH